MKKMIFTAVFLALVAALIMAVQEGEAYELSEYKIDMEFHNEMVGK